MILGLALGGASVNLPTQKRATGFIWAPIWLVVTRQVPAAVVLTSPRKDLWWCHVLAVGKPWGLCGHSSPETHIAACKDRLFSPPSF